jgi:hypothetical protein
MIRKINACVSQFSFKFIFEIVGTLTFYYSIFVIFCKPKRNVRIFLWNEYKFTEMDIVRWMFRPFSNCCNEHCDNNTLRSWL